MKKIIFAAFLVIVCVCLNSTTIYDIQYTTVPGPDNTYPSLLNGQVVTVTGIVTGSGYYTSGNSNRFFMTDPGGGPWKGIFVFNYDFVVEEGDEVVVTGTVTEYYGMTEISYVTDVTILSSGNAVPPPVIAQTANLVNPAVAEQYEGCLVQVQNVVVTSAQNNYGEWYVTDTSAVPCQVDDGFFLLNSVEPPIVITVGMDWAIIRGCVDYSYNEFAINPRYPEDLIDEVSAPPVTVSPLFEFIGCYPNPFNPETTAYLNLAKAGNLKLTVFNIKGEKVRTIVDKEFSAGEHHITWNGKDDNNASVASGIYFIFADADNGDFTSVRKIILMK